MPDVNGLAFVNSLPKNKRPLVVFVTAHEEYAVRSYELEVLDYLVKPIGAERLRKSLQKAEVFLELKEIAESAKTTPSKDFLLVHSEYQLVKIDLSDILYIQSMGDYVKIHLDGKQKQIMTLERLKNIEQQLKNKGFYRIHRSYVVNQSKISAFQKSKVQIKEAWLPITQTYAHNIAHLMR